MLSSCREKVKDHEPDDLLALGIQNYSFFDLSNASLKKHNTSVFMRRIFYLGDAHNLAYSIVPWRLVFYRIKHGSSLVVEVMNFEVLINLLCKLVLLNLFIECWNESECLSLI